MESEGGEKNSKCSREREKESESLKAELLSERKYERNAKASLSSLQLQSGPIDTAHTNKNPRREREREENDERTRREHLDLSRYPPDVQEP